MMSLSWNVTASKDSTFCKLPAYTIIHVCICEQIAFTNNNNIIMVYVLYHCTDPDKQLNTHTNLYACLVYGRTVNICMCTA